MTTRMSAMAMVPLPIHIRHALRAGALPPRHKDPFDRLLVAQGQLEGVRLLTADEQFRDYDVQLIWAA